MTIRRGFFAQGHLEFRFVHLPEWVQSVFIPLTNKMSECDRTFSLNLSSVRFQDKCARRTLIDLLSLQNGLPTMSKLILFQRYKLPALRETCLSNVPRECLNVGPGNHAGDTKWFCEDFIVSVTICHSLKCHFSPFP